MEAEINSISEAADVLALFDVSIAGAGLAGERRNARVLYLALTSRLLERPVSVAIKGPPAGGKSFLLERVLAHFPSSAALKLSGMSEKSLIYTDENLAHRHIVLAEAQGAEGRMQSYFVRTLLSEGELVWHAVEQTREGTCTRTVRKTGPTGLILTTTRIEDEAEIESRMLTLLANDTREQTRSILRAVVCGETQRRVDDIWPAYQHWLATGECRVVVPFAAALAERCSDRSVRMRRDISTALSMVKAHALLHRATRRRDEQGTIVATVDDYEAVRQLIADILAEGTDAAVSASVRQTVGAVLAHSADASCGVATVARALNIDLSSASRRCKSAVRAGFIEYRRESKWQAANFRLVRAIPDDLAVLPSLQVARRVPTTTNPATE